MVNHFLLEDEELVERLIDLIQELSYWDDDKDEIQLDENREMFEVKAELLSRLKN
jgi:hypothetical protein